MESVDDFEEFIKNYEDGNFWATSNISSSLVPEIPIQGTNSHSNGPKPINSSAVLSMGPPDSTNKTSVTSSTAKNMSRSGSNTLVNPSALTKTESDNMMLTKLVKRSVSQKTSNEELQQKAKLEVGVNDLQCAITTTALGQTGISIQNEIPARQSVIVLSSKLPTLSSPKPPSAFPQKHPLNVPTVTLTQPTTALLPNIPPVSPSNSTSVALSNLPSVAPSMAKKITANLLLSLAMDHQNTNQNALPTAFPKEPPTVPLLNEPKVPRLQLKAGPSRTASTVDQTTTPAIAPPAPPAIAPLNPPAVTPVVPPRIPKHPVPPGIAPPVPPPFAPPVPPHFAPPVPPAIAPPVRPPFAPPVPPAIAPPVRPPFAPPVPPAIAPPTLPAVAPPAPPAIAPLNPPAIAPLNPPAVPPVSPPRIPTLILFRRSNLRQHTLTAAFLQSLSSSIASSTLQTVPSIQLNQLPPMTGAPSPNNSSATMHPSPSTSQIRCPPPTNNTNQIFQYVTQKAYEVLKLISPPQFTDSFLEAGFFKADIVEPHHLEYSSVSNYVVNSQAHTSFGIELLSVLKISRPNTVATAQASNLNPEGTNRFAMMLWHGTKPTRVASILKDGFKCPQAGSQMFGKGVYFADRISKSAQYCNQNLYCAIPRPGEVGYLFLCEVTLGKCYNAKNVKQSYRVAPTATRYDGSVMTFDSIKCTGENIPDRQHQKEIDGVIWPLGRTIKNTRFPTYTVLYNEFIVYNPEMVKLKYLVKVQFK